MCTVATMSLMLKPNALEKCFRQCRTGQCLNNLQINHQYIFVRVGNVSALQDARI